MAQYAKVRQKIWNSRKFHTLDRTGQLLWLYLLTCPHGNLLGCFVLKSGYALADLGPSWTEKEFESELKKLTKKDLLTYDENHHFIVIHNYLEHNPLRGDKQLKAAKTKLEDLPDSKIILEKLYLILTAFESTAYDTLLIPLRYRIDTLSDTVAVSVALTVAETVTVTLPKIPKNGFDQFWKAYPRKRSKGQAETTWKKIKPDPELLKKILAGIVAAKKSHAWMKDDGEFIPHPSTWLNAKGWEDEHETFRRRSESGAKPMQEPSKDLSDWNEF